MDLARARKIIDELTPMELSNLETELYDLYDSVDIDRASAEALDEWADRQMAERHMGSYGVASMTRLAAFLRVRASELRTLRAIRLVGASGLRGRP